MENLKEETKNYFAQRFAQDHVQKFDLNMENHPKITEAQAIFLETTPSREEVKAAVWASGIDKAPGFDGFISNSSGKCGKKLRKKSTSLLWTFSLVAIRFDT